MCACGKSIRVFNIRTSKTVFEWKEMILVIAPFFAITLFFACQNDQSNENIWKLSENFTEFTNLHKSY